MTHATLFLLHYGYVVVFLWVLLEQLGLPVPSLPLLLAVGALAGNHKMSLEFALFLAVIACLIADATWYHLGRKRGGRVLTWLCKISLEPDSCVRRTEELYVRYGAKSLLVAKFIPGFSTIAPPLAGIFRMRPHRFYVYDFAGAFLWAGSFVTAGFLLSNQLDRAANFIQHFGISVLGVLLIGLALFVLYKYIDRRRFIRKLRVARISPTELKSMMDAGEEVFVVDLRHSLDFEADPETIPGALRLSPEEIEKDEGDFPRDRQIILYCT
jgi:membrane protein DedA with SNARE-associated domain